MKISILSGIKEVISEMTDSSNGTISVRQEPIPNGLLAQKGLSEERVKFLNKFINLLLKTSFINQRTKTYLLEKNGSYKTVADKLKLQQGIDVKASTLQSIVWMDKNKIERYFTPNVLLDVIEYTNTDISEYVKTVQELNDKYGQASLLEKNVIIELPKSTIKKSEFDDDSFNECMQSLIPYIRSQANYASETMKADFIGYLKYLLNSDGTELNGKDLSRKGILVSLLS